MNERGRFGSDCIYNIKMVSQLLDLPTVTIRAWENRYGVIEPLRDENGHRMYTDENVADLKWLIDQTKHNGLSIKHAANLLLEKKKEQPKQLSVEPKQLSQHIELKESLYSSLIRVNAVEANRLIDIGFSMYEFSYMLHQVLVPLLVRIGDEWEAGNISVAEEHFSTELIKQRLFQFMRVFQQNALFPKMLAACPADEYHEVGLLVFTLFLRRKGVDVVYLGANTPADGLIEMQQRLAIEYVLLSSSNLSKYKQHMKFIEQVKQQNPHTTFIIGGAGFEPYENDQPHIIKLNGDQEEWEQWFKRTFPLQRLT